MEFMVSALGRICVGASRTVSFTGCVTDVGRKRLEMAKALRQELAFLINLNGFRIAGILAISLPAWKMLGYRTALLLELWEATGLVFIVRLLIRKRDEQLGKAYPAISGGGVASTRPSYEASSYGCIFSYEAQFYAHDDSQAGG